MNLKTMASVVIGLAVSAVASQAAIALQSFNSTWYANAGVSDTLGWEFKANNNITVTDLGFLEKGLQNPRIPVGLWTANGTLLGQVTVTTLSSVDNGFLYAPLSLGIPLTAGQNYLIGALFQPNDSAYGNSSAEVTAPEVTYIGGRYTVPYSTSLSAPTTVFGSGVFGPNFKFTATPVPEPSTYLAGLSALGMLGFFGWRKRK